MLWSKKKDINLSCVHLIEKVFKDGITKRVTPYRPLTKKEEKVTKAFGIPLLCTKNRGERTYLIIVRIFHIFGCIKNELNVDIS